MTSRAVVYRARSPVRPVLRESGSSVLLVTGDDSLAGTCRQALEREGYAVTVASHSGHALLECLGGHHADVLLTELSMPDGSGPELAERLQRYFPKLRTVFIANADTDRAVENLDVLVRPFSDDELLARIRASLTSSAS
jgi:DNA-binding response OmpR family regulator